MCHTYLIALFPLLKNTHPRKVDKLFRGLVFFFSAIFSLGHGANYAQKAMGIIAILLFSSSHLGSEFYVPVWLIFTCYGANSLGTLAGGKNIIKTLLRSGLTHLKPVKGFSAETAGAIAIIGSTFGGIPVSTTQTITGAIMGVGLTKRVSSIRWGVATN